METAELTEFVLPAAPGATHPLSLFEKPVVFMHAERQSGATFNQQGDVLPKILAAKTDERIARGIRPVGGGDHLPHDGGMRPDKRLHFLVIIIKPRRAVGGLLPPRRVTVKGGEIAQLASGLIRSERVTVVKIA